MLRSDGSKKKKKKKRKLKEKFYAAKYPKKYLGR